MTYFLYRMRHQIRFLIVTFTLNVFGLGLFSVNTLISMKSRYMSYISDGIPVSYNLDVLTNGTAAISAMAVLVLALFGAVSAFDYCLKGESIDTYYGLPVTLRGKFWADFLSGYISHVAPLIPCSIFSMIMSVSVDDWNNKLSLLMNNTDQSGVVIQAFAKLNLTLLFSYTFAYLLSVIVTVCCGRVRSSVTYTAVCSIILMITGCAASGFVMLCQLGAGDIRNAIASVKNIPPLGTFFFKAKGIFDLISNKYFNTEEKLYASVFDDSLTIDPATCIILTVIIAVLVAASYFIFKHRKPENTGQPIAVKGFYYVFSGVVAFTLICLCCFFTYYDHNWWLSALISFIAAGIALLIFTAAGRPKKAHIKAAFIRGLAVTAGSILLLVIVDKTGAFGTRYYNISPSKTKSIRIILNDYGDELYFREKILLEDQTDIEKFIKLHNTTLKKHSDQLREGAYFIVTYDLANGKRIERFLDYRDNTVKAELINNVRSLPNYPKLSSISCRETIEESNSSLHAVIHDKFGEVSIPGSRAGELAEILSNEVREKYDATAVRAGYVKITSNEYGNSEYIPISEKYTDTISFVESFREYDENAEAFNIYLGYYPMSTSMSTGHLSMRVCVKIKDIGGEAEKELFSLFSKSRDNRAYNFTISASNGLSYYVPEENAERVTELILTIIEKSLAQ